LPNPATKVSIPGLDLLKALAGRCGLIDAIWIIGMYVAPELRAAREIEEGIYIIRTERGLYVGQSGKMTSRLRSHSYGPNFTKEETEGAERIFVPGGKEAREIAEQRKIDELKRKGENLLNKRNPIGERRKHLMGSGYERP
jgi:predicted GIY-YIG superfamily endonuclease